MKASTILSVAFFLALSASAQEASHARPQGDTRPKAHTQAHCKFSDGKTITVDYSSPRAKGRKIYGELVPYGKVWRAGANEATTFVTTGDVVVGGKSVPAGNYTIFAIPDKDKWTLVISKATGEWGTDYPGPDKDLARVEMKVSTLPSPVENFTISLAKTGGGATMNMDWDTTRTSVAITAK